MYFLVIFFAFVLSIDNAWCALSFCYNIETFNTFYSRSKPYTPNNFNGPLILSYGGIKGYKYRLPIIVEYLLKGAYGQYGVIHLQEVLNDSEVIEYLEKELGEVYHIAHEVYHSRNDACQLVTLIDKRCVYGENDVVKLVYKDINTNPIVDTILMTYIPSQKRLTSNIHVGTKTETKQKLATEGILDAIRFATSEIKKTGKHISFHDISGDFNAFDGEFKDGRVYSRKEYIKNIKESVQTATKINCQIPSEKAVSLLTGRNEGSFMPAPTDYLFKSMRIFADSYGILPEEIYNQILPILEESLSEKTCLADKDKSIILDVKRKKESYDRFSEKNIKKILQRFNVAKIEQLLMSSPVYNKMNKNGTFSELFSGLKTGVICEGKEKIFIKALNDIYSIIRLFLIQKGKKENLDLILVAGKLEEKDVLWEEGKLHDEDIFVPLKKLFGKQISEMPLYIDEANFLKEGI